MSKCASTWRLLAEKAAKPHQRLRRKLLVRMQKRAAGRKESRVNQRNKTKAASVLVTLMRHN